MDPIEEITARATQFVQDNFKVVTADKINLIETAMLLGYSLALEHTVKQEITQVNQE